MSRPRNPIPTIKRSISLPETLWARIDILLFSELEGRIPHGALSDFLGSAATLYLKELASESGRTPIVDRNNAPEEPSWGNDA